MSYFFIFLRSNLLEIPVYLLFMKTARKDLSIASDVVFITGLNAVTHPIVFFGIMNLKLTYLQNILLAESFAILSESLILKRTLTHKLFPCLLISLFANLLSWQFAPMLTYALH